MDEVEVKLDLVRVRRGLRLPLGLVAYILGKCGARARDPRYSSKLKICSRSPASQNLNISRSQSREFLVTF